MLTKFYGSFGSYNDPHLFWTKPCTLHNAHIHYSLTFLLQTKEKDLTVQIDKLGEVGASTGDQEGHLVTVQELIQVHASVLQTIKK